MKISLLFILLVTSYFSYCQVITVKDINNNQPLELVTIFSKDKNIYITTNKRGIADIKNLIDCKDIEFRLLGYKSLSLAYEDIKNMNFIVLMETSNITLSEIVVSSTRWQQEKRDVPSKISSIRVQDIAFNNPQSAADILSMSGDVFVQKSQLGGGSPMIRGFATNRILITVDGVRMNNAIFRSGNIQNVISIDPLSIKNVELLFGPGAVMYGSDAIGGAMNFYSHNPIYANDTSIYFSASAFSRYSSANNENSFHLMANVGFRKFAFITSAGFSSFSDLLAGKYGPSEYLRPEYASTINHFDTIIKNSNPRLQIPSAYNQMNIMQKISYKPSKKLNFNYGFFYTATTDVPRYDRLTEYRNNKLRDAEWYYGPQQWMMNYLSINYKNKLLLFDNTNITIAHQLFEESRHSRSFNKTTLFHKTENVDAFSVNIDFTKEINSNKTFFYGIELVNNLISSKAKDEDINTGVRVPSATRYPDGSSWLSMSKYVNYSYRISEKITWQTGLRYSYFNIKADFDTIFYSFPFKDVHIKTGSLSGSTGIAYKPNQSLQINLNLSSGFRAPNIDDIGKVFDSEPGAVIVPNPHLKSEYAKNIEGGIIKILNRNIKIDATAYYTHLTNAMVRRDFSLNDTDSILYENEMSKIIAIQNAASAFVYGIQSGFEVKLPYGIGIISKITYQQGKEELDNKSLAPLRHAVPLFGSTHIIYTKNKIKTDLSVFYQGKIKNSELAPSEQSKTHIYALNSEGKPYSPSWYSVNFKIAYNINSFLTANAGVENILNKLYRPYSSGISAPGRNFIFSIKYQL